MKCKVCGNPVVDTEHLGMCIDCWKQADCCGLEKL
jgi:hypothetical protein